MTKTSKRQQIPRWYERERWMYADDRQSLKKYAEFLRLFPWKLYGTFTFAHKIGDDEADWQFASFIDCLERALKANVAHVRGAEKRFSGCGKPASRRHFHVVLTSTADLRKSLVEALWVLLTQNREDGAKVEVYDGCEDAVYYILKKMNTVHGEWDHRNLQLFHPQGNTLPLNTRQRRTFQRHQARLLAQDHRCERKPVAADCT